MGRILTFNHKIINPGNNRYFGSFGSSPGPTPPTPPEPTVYDVILTTDGHGSISANPMSGVKDTLITLSNTPAQNYVFSKYTLNNVDLAGNTFLMPEADANVKGWFEADMRTITVTQPSHGTITAPASAQVGSTVTLSITTDTGYALQYFTVNGTQIQGNSFVMPASNVTVSASLAVPFNPSFITIDGTVWMTSNLDVDDGGEGIYHTDVTYTGIGTVTEYYYTGAAAQRVANSIPGWHLSTNQEWVDLASIMGGWQVTGPAIKSTQGWVERNGTGGRWAAFNARPAGHYDGTSLSGIGSNTGFWTSTPDSDWPDDYDIRTLSSSNDRLYKSSQSPNRNYYSVRLVRD